MGAMSSPQAGLSEAVLHHEQAAEAVPQTNGPVKGLCCKACLAMVLGDFTMQS